MSSAAWLAERRVTLARSIGMALSASGGGGAGDPGAEEVVGGRGGEHLVAERLGQRRHQQAGVDVAVVVGGEDDRPLEAVEAVEAPALGLGDGGDHRPQHALEDEEAGVAGGEAAGPVGVVVGAGPRLLAARLDGLGHRGRAVREVELAHVTDGERRRPDAAAPPAATRSTPCERLVVMPSRPP